MFERSGIFVPKTDVDMHWQQGFNSWSDSQRNSEDKYVRTDCVVSWLFAVQSNPSSGLTTLLYVMKVTAILTICSWWIWGESGIHGDTRVFPTFIHKLWTHTHTPTNMCMKSDGSYFPPSSLLFVTGLLWPFDLGSLHQHTKSSGVLLSFS